MILRIIRQTVCQARRQWEMSLVSLFGTAFAIFLVMVVVVVNRVDHAPFPPVSDRARLLYARGVDISFGNGSRSAAYSPAFAMEIYAGPAPMLWRCIHGSTSATPRCAARGLSM